MSNRRGMHRDCALLFGVMAANIRFGPEAKAASLRVFHRETASEHVILEEGSISAIIR